jgi:hypothetical protein
VISTGGGSSVRQDLAISPGADLVAGARGFAPSRLPESRDQIPHNPHVSTLADELSVELALVYQRAAMRLGLGEENGMAIR